MKINWLNIKVNLLKKGDKMKKIDFDKLKEAIWNIVGCST